MPDDWKPKRAWELLRIALAKIGRITPDGAWMEKLLIDAGFVDVTVCDPIFVGCTLVALPLLTIDHLGLFRVMAVLLNPPKLSRTLTKTLGADSNFQAAPNALAKAKRPQASRCSFRDVC